MKPTFLRPSRYLAAAAAALAVTLGTAYAAGQGMPHPAGPGGPFMMKRLDALHAELKLSPEQEQKWQAALATMKRDHEAMRANHDRMRDQFKAAAQQPILDFDALHASHMQIEQQDAQLRDETAKAWLAVYDSLDDRQKTTVSTEFKQHLAKMERRHEKMRERWEKHNGAGVQ